jgi:SNF2 family DNA or RNA helicase
VLVGTAAIEQGLNLQIARHLICVDQIMNPARMQQLAGRIKRVGSAYKTVYVHNLLTLNTQEEGYLDLLMREQALADHIWSESNQLYEALSPLALLQLVGGTQKGHRP